MKVRVVFSGRTTGKMASALIKHLKVLKEAEERKRAKEKRGAK